MRARIGVALLLCAVLLMGCRRSPAAETEIPPSAPTAAQTPAPAATLDGWQEAYSQILRPENRKEREKAREEADGTRSVEEYYAVCDMDKDEIPQLLIIYWEQGRYYADLYVCLEEKPVLAGTFYCGRLDFRFYIRPEEAGLWNEAVRVDPLGETHWWRKFTLTDGVLEEQELLDETIEWEGEGAFMAPARPAVTVEELLPDAEEVSVAPIPDEGQPFRLILDYVLPTSL